MPNNRPWMDDIPDYGIATDYELVQYTIYSTIRTRLRAHKVNASPPMFYLLSDRRHVTLGFYKCTSCPGLHTMTTLLFYTIY